ncbi:MAG: ATP-dependent DNA helicase RecQ, partial [Polyangiales bacterium]
PDSGARARDPVAVTRQEIDDVLRERFGLDTFRPGQREAIDALLGEPGQVLLVAPTGGGKSLTYQLPAALLPGLTLVISPLVALMEDQVRGLTARGIAATYVASSIDGHERRAREQAAREGAYKLLYCAPERLASAGFVDFLASCPIDLIAIDEAHCIAQWGHDFRPDYLRIGDVLRRVKPPRLLACTATATPRVRDEIRERLGMAKAHELIRGFARPNLHLSARSVDGIKDARKLRDEALESALGSPKAPRGSAIVYCATRKSTEQVAAELKGKKWNVAAYHAGMDSDVRAEVNASFATGKLDVVVATNAFGMGIDRADVRAVVHMQPPASLEAYYQEVGRAGRDGDEAHGLLLCSGSDVALRRRLCEGGMDGPAPRELAARAWNLFRELLRYLDAGSCRHDFILRYFGDEREVLGGCGHCDVCGDLDGELGDEGKTEASQQDAIDIRKGLAGVARAKQRGGLVAIGEMLHGEASERVERFGFDTLSTFGILKDRPTHFIVGLLRALLAAGFIDLTPNDHPVPFVTPLGWEIMKGTGAIRLRLPRADAEPRGAASARRRERRERSSKVVDGPPLSSDEQALFDALRQHRAERAKERKLPAYVIAQDATLTEIARVRPKSPSELLGIRGMGPLRIENYGDGFLEVVRRHRG